MYPGGGGRVEADMVVLAPVWKQLALTIPSAENSSGLFPQAGQPCPPITHPVALLPLPRGTRGFAESLWLCFLDGTCVAAASATTGQRVTSLPLSGLKYRPQSLKRVLTTCS